MKTAAHNSLLPGRVEMEELKPCPFCGSEDVGVSYGRKKDGSPWPYVECTDCAAMVAGGDDSELEARRAWNQRALESSFSRAQERLKEAADIMMGLIDVQNGCPLEKYRDAFEKTNARAREFIHRLATEDKPEKEEDKS